MVQLSDPAFHDQPMSCPACGAAFIGRAAGGHAGKTPRMAPGDSTLCEVCEALGIMTADGSLRRPTEAEERALLADPRVAEAIKHAGERRAARAAGATPDEDPGTAEMRAHLKTLPREARVAMLMDILAPAVERSGRVFGPACVMSALANIAIDVARHHAEEGAAADGFETAAKLLREFAAARVAAAARGDQAAGEAAP